MPEGIMTVFTSEQDKAKAEMIFKVEGRVTSIDWEALREFCLETLKHSGDIVLDLEKVSEYDFSLTVFVCLFRRTVQLQGKHLSIIGKEEEFSCLDSQGAQCSNIEASARCLCESLFIQTNAPLIQK
jgi:anti-anti-sigma regulatory factor